MANDLQRPPTPAAQRELLRELLRRIHPLIARHKLPAQFECEPGMRLRRRYGTCQHRGGGRAPLITVRCTADGDRRAWRRPSAIVGTLVHELAHLRYRGHTRRFWALCRALLDDAAALGLYDVRFDDPMEQPQGRAKLAGSAAAPIAIAALEARRRDARAARELVSRWSVGVWAKVRTRRGPLAGMAVQVLAKRRTRLLVQTRDGQRYLVAVRALEPAGVENARSARHGNDLLELQVGLLKQRALFGD